MVQAQTTSSQHTPMMAQYLRVKADYPDCLVFYRMGDFYELFFDDAIIGSKALDITLTKRGQSGGEDVAMCGVPAHSHEAYVARLIKAGFRVAICEQLESPEEAKKRSGKTLVKRDVVRVITAGTLTEDSLLDQTSHNYLMVIIPNQDHFAAAWVDISTGAFFVHQDMSDRLLSLIERISPNEIIAPETFRSQDLYQLLLQQTGMVHTLPDVRFDQTNAHKRVCDIFKIARADGLGNFNQDELTAAGVVLDYLQQTQKNVMPSLNRPQTLKQSNYMEIDAATLRNLEIFKTLSGQRKGSLLQTIDRTSTNAGARLLQQFLALPLCDLDTINQRLDGVAFFAKHQDSRDDIQANLKELPDLERALSRVSVHRATPHDLAALKNGLQGAQEIRQLLADQALPPYLKSYCDDMIIPTDLDHVIDKLERALKEELPATIRDGGFIETSYHPPLDEQIKLRDEGRRLIAQLQSQYNGETNISTLKIKHNNMLGYFIEVTASHADKLLNANDDVPTKFHHRQTLANAVRFTTERLTQLEQDIARAGERALAMELEIFEALCAEVLQQAETIRKIAHAIARIDVAHGLANLASDQNYKRPDLTNETVLDIKIGRHPVVEQTSAVKTSNGFVGNDLNLAQQQNLWLITGPNMAGKSTFLRQNALIVLLAQIGSFVPADSAKIGITDRLFSRVGAADDLARGQSTFMVEMTETAAILNQATEKSLVILDEIGRGTATFDGLSIAWACLEHLINTNKCRTLFATHYHELTDLQHQYKQLSCYTMSVKEWKDDIIFLHKIIQGTADSSYGIHVAKLAGLPSSVIDRAQTVLSEIISNSHVQVTSQTDLFENKAIPKSEEKIEHPAIKKLSSLSPDSLSPKEALDLIYELHKETKDI